MPNFNTLLTHLNDDQKAVATAELDAWFAGKFAALVDQHIQ